MFGVIFFLVSFLLRNSKINRSKWRSFQRIRGDILCDNLSFFHNIRLKLTFQRFFPLYSCKLTWNVASFFFTKYLSLSVKELTSILQLLFFFCFVIYSRPSVYSLVWRESKNTTTKHSKSKNDIDRERVGSLMLYWHNLVYQILPISMEISEHTERGCVCVLCVVWRITGSIQLHCITNERE